MQRNQKGFTLIELMVGMVIVGFIFVGVGSMFKSQVAVSVSNRDEAEMQSSVQAALNMIANDIISAGLGNPNVPFAIADVSGAALGTDTLTLRSTFTQGRGMNSVLLSNSLLAAGTSVPVRCWGENGNGTGKRHPTRDIGLVPGHKTFLLFVDPFTANPLTDIGNNPVELVDLDPPLSVGTCSTDGSVSTVSNIVAGTPDPAVGLQTAASVGPLRRGTVIYGYTCPPCDGANLPIIIYSVDTARNLLLQNGQPVLFGVEDFQVRFFSDPLSPGSACPGGCDVLTGLTPAQIRQLNRVDLGLVVRLQHLDPHDQGDLRDNITTFGHTLALTAAHKEYMRKIFQYTVRPKNSSDFQ